MRRCAIVLIAAGIAVALPAAGQTLPTVPQSCDIVSCSLRVEGGGFFSRPKLVRGRESEEVATLGAFVRDLSPVFAPVPSSVERAASFRRRRNAASALSGAA